MLNMFIAEIVAEAIQHTMIYSMYTLKLQNIKIITLIDV